MRVLKHTLDLIWFTLCSLTGQTALIIGATGQAGRHLLRELLDSPAYTRILEAGRRVTPAEQLPPTASGKLEQRVIDFENLADARLAENGGFDVVYITCAAPHPVMSIALIHRRLGSTKKAAGSATLSEKINRECVSSLTLLHP